MEILTPIKPLGKLSFTRMGGQSAKDGWQATDISEGVPPEAVERYCTLQGENVSFCKSVPPGDSFSVIELKSDNSYTYLSQIRYGIKDEKGRPSMLAKGAVFNLEEFIAFPELILPQTQGEEIISPFNLERLIKCVYNTLENKKGDALYITCDDDFSEGFVLEIMSLIYNSIFPSFRGGLSFSAGFSYDTSDIFFLENTRLIFVKSLPENNDVFYFSIRTGGTNISDKVLKKYDEYSFMICPPERFFDKEYFSCFEKRLLEYGVVKTTSLKLYKLVYDEGDIDSLSDDEIPKKLNELLGITVPIRKKLDEQILALFEMITEKKIFINDIIFSKLIAIGMVTENINLSAICHCLVYRELSFELLTDIDGALAFVFNANELMVEQENAVDEQDDSEIESLEFEIEFETEFDDEISDIETENQENKEDESTKKTKLKQNKPRFFDKIFGKSNLKPKTKSNNKNE